MTHTTPPVTANPGFVEEVVLQGHIIDSLLLPKVLDEIVTRGGSYVLRDIRIGQRQTDTSFVRIAIQAPAALVLREILDAIHDHGAVPQRLIEADLNVVLPDWPWFPWLA